MKRYEVNWHKLSLPIVLIGTIIISLFMGCKDVKESFVLVWSDTKNEVHVQHSFDGKTWKDSKLPLKLTSIKGPGLAADPTGILHYLSGVNSNGDRWGLGGIGPDGYINKNIETLSDWPKGTMSSGTSIASTSTEKWYFAYQSVGSVKLLYREHKVTPDPAKSDYIWKDETPVYQVNNTKVVGRPAIAIKGNRAVLSWFRKPAGSNGELQIATGDIQADGTIKWIGGQVFPNSEPNVGAVEQPFDLCSNGKDFYLGVLRADNPSSGWYYSLYIYKSSDGSKWTLYTMVGKNTPGVKQSFTKSLPIDIAVNSKGVIVMSQLDKGFNFKGFWYFDKAWSTAPSTLTSGYPDSKKDFTLTATAYK